MRICRFVRFLTRIYLTLNSVYSIKSAMNSFSSDLNDGDGLLNWSSLQEWILQANLPGKGEIVNCVQLSGGTQNNLFLVTREDSTEMVLRRPPRHPRPHNDRTMMREAKVLEALSGARDSFL